MQVRSKLILAATTSTNKQANSKRIRQCVMKGLGERSRAMQQQMKVIKEAIISIINMLGLLWPTD